MNKLKSMKYKPDDGVHNDFSLFDKISKRYSNVRFLRKSANRKDPPIQITGSYDMNGRNSDDHKLEIGAPILISKTTIDTDSIIDTTLFRHSDCSQLQRNSDQSDSYHDANSSLDTQQSSFHSSASSNEERIVESAYAKIKPLPIIATTIATTGEVNNNGNFIGNRSKSATNLHKTELSVYLQRSPSMEITNQFIEPVVTVKNNYNNVYNGFRIGSKQSIESDSSFHNSRNSITVNGSVIDEEALDFDMKSASFQSLDARNIFLSIEELNEITRQINESDEFRSMVDGDHHQLEYQIHRENLKPCERRVTLLRNRNQRFLNITPKRDKLTNAWSGFKNWIGEEKGKIKEVVNKHSAMQRVGANSKSTNGETTAVDGVTVVNGTALQITQNVTETNNEQHQNRFNGGDNEQHQQYRINGSESNDFNSLNRKTLHEIEGQNGFEELRRYVKQGSDFGKDLVAVLQERVESEQLYAKSLSKMASKLNKACREVPGTLAEAWRNVAAEMESRSEVHRQFSTTMTEEIVKPLKQLLDNQHKMRKSIDGNVDKSARVLAEWRTSEAKAKKSSHSAARENEKLQDAMLDVRIQRSPSIAHQNSSAVSIINNNTNSLNSNKDGSTGTGLLGLHKAATVDKEIKNAEKDCAKLDNKRRKAEESVKRADVEYYTLCIRAERARIDWEISVLRGSTVFQSHEHQRLQSLKAYLTTYLKLSNDMNPNFTAIVERLTPHVNACNVQKDLSVIKNIRRVSEGPSEQLLPDFYCEHTTLAMNRDRRKHALVKLLQLVRTDLDRERKSRSGLKGLSQSLNSQENQSVTDKLYHIRSMLTYLEGARFKLQSALLELDHKPRGSHPLGPHIQITRDRTGLQQSILKVPLWLKNDEEKPNTDSEAINSNDDDAASTVDSKNEVLIKNFDRNFGRSKSSIEYPVGITTGAGTASTIIVDSRNLENIDFDRGIADGGSNQHDSDFDEFSSQDEEDEISSRNSVQGTTYRRPTPNPSTPKIISHCKAIYAYSPKLDDELEINPGDLIDVHIKQEDGWWVGAIKDRVGIFPATYVEELV
ncbi:uncharacterized protein LOC116344673 [Contarinia nasturtii]|uniref:uncharacterized protein LOC116344673 n=1 Tax=Contarinia nasturtii TaxID=265458 RepID=UPI0012D3C6E4|nr:uncharacterized protein LOC116344673 [Contarinia nasturtii]XP_031629182.1 uncharacterized protein LOC116344673 [Contarinia nasturtii]XP_031629183.1 uncharacterized protein LOC116344673 [Contarinia nasturtii]XP_031629184.1 uncharacterized protein LOC116344673 [Contarinia nasturtii]